MTIKMKKILLFAFAVAIIPNAFADYSEIQMKIISKLPENVQVHNNWQTSYNDYQEVCLPSWLGGGCTSDYFSKQDFIYLSPSSFIISMASDSAESCSDGSCGLAVVSVSCQRNYRDYVGSKHSGVWVPKTSSDLIEVKSIGTITFYYYVSTGFGTKTLNIVLTPLTKPDGTIVPAPIGSGTQLECIHSVINNRIVPLNGIPL